MNLLIHELKRKNPDLKAAEIEGVLHLILNETSLTNTTLIRVTGLPKQTLQDLKASLGQLLAQNTVSDKILLTVEGTDILTKLNPRPYIWSLVEYKDVIIEKQLENIRKTYISSAKRAFDQFLATPQTTVAKARILLNKGVVLDGQIAFLGDDDLVSIALALMTDDYSCITVFDIDPDLLSLIQRVCKDLSIKTIQTVQYDARTDLNKGKLHNYDAVITDPPYTTAGVSLFVERSLELLKSTGYLFLYYGNSFKSPEKLLKIQNIINGCNLVLEDKIDKFARYVGAESIGSASSVYVLKATSFTKTLGEAPTTNIYTHEADKVEKFPFVEHTSIKLWGLDVALITSKNKILSTLNDFCREYKLKVTDTKVMQNTTIGSTYNIIGIGFVLNATSWLKQTSLYIDLVTTTPIRDKTSLSTNLTRLFKTQKLEIRFID